MADCRNLLAHLAYGEVLVTDNSNSLPSFLSFILLSPTVASGLCKLSVCLILLFKCKVFRLSIVYPLGKDKGDWHTMLTLNLCCVILAKIDTFLEYSFTYELPVTYAVASAAHVFHMRCLNASESVPGFVN